MQDFFSILSNFGFPVAVASYLLFRFEKKLEELAKTNSLLVEKVEKLSENNGRLAQEIEGLKKVIKTRKK